MRATLAMLLVVISASCIGDDDGDGDLSNYVLITELEAAYKDANCTYLANCGLFPDKATCMSANLTSLSGTSQYEIDPDVVAAVGAGRVYYQGTNVKACFTALAARSCDKTSESARSIPPACRDFIRGRFMNGEPCTIDEECVSQQCSAPSDNDACVMGQCLGDVAPVVMPAEINQPCNQSSGCVSGAYCDFSTDVCTALKTMGASCTQQSECAYGLGCVGSVGTRTCALLPAVGETCSTSEYQCRDEGARCSYNSTTMTYSCVMVGLAMATCSSSQDCSPYYPCSFSTYQCTRGPALNEPCSSSQRCFDDNTFCDFNTSMCTALRQSGMACQSDDECQSGFCDQNLATPLCGQPTVCF